MYSTKKSKTIRPFDINFSSLHKENIEQKNTISSENFEEIINLDEEDEFNRFRELIKSCYG